MINKPRGTEDITGIRARKFNAIENIIAKISALYGYNEIRTPIFENIEVFVRSVGATSDIVKKEFYNFTDKGGREIALRPEGTAAVIRSVVENKLLDTQPLPIKFSYTGPMFRYERPQSGRMRQFHQYGFEVIGTNSVYDDADVLAMAIQVLKTIGIKDYKVIINNLGNFESRGKWIQKLKDYFVPYKTELTELSQERLLTNPTRILDDKVDGLKYFVKNAPKISSFLSQDEINDQKKLEKALNELGINFIYDETMVRGLDYYTNFVFEVVSTNPGLSGQSTLIGGGRYGKLISEFGGPDASSIGLAMGIERLIMQCDFEEINIADEQNIDVVIAALSPTCEEKAIEILAILRKNNISAVCKFDQQKLIKVFNYASRINARYVAVLGEKELSNNTIVIKNQKTMAQEEISIQDIINYIH